MADLAASPSIAGTSDAPPPHAVSAALAALHRLYRVLVRAVELTTFVQDNVVDLNGEAIAAANRSGSAPLGLEGAGLPLTRAEHAVIFANLAELGDAVEQRALLLHQAFAVWSGAKAHLGSSFSEGIQRLKHGGFAVHGLPAQPPPWTTDHSPQASGIRGGVPSLRSVLLAFVCADPSPDDIATRQSTLRGGGGGSFAFGTKGGGISSEPSGAHNPDTESGTPAAVFSPAEVSVAQGGKPESSAFEPNARRTASTPISPKAGAGPAAHPAGSFALSDGERDSSEPLGAAPFAIAQPLQQVLDAFTRYACNFVRRAAPTLERLAAVAASGTRASGPAHIPEFGAATLERGAAFLEVVGHSLAAAPFKELRLPEDDPLRIQTGGATADASRAALDLLALLGAPLHVGYQLSSLATAIAANLAVSAVTSRTEAAVVGHTAAALTAFVHTAHTRHLNNVANYALSALARHSATFALSRFENVKLPANPRRALLHRGTLCKKYSRGRHNRVFLLFNDYLLYGENPADDGGVVGHGGPSGSAGAAGSSGSGVYSPPPLSRHADRSFPLLPTGGPRLRSVGSYALLTGAGRRAVTVTDHEDNPFKGLQNAFTVCFEVPKRKELLLTAGSATEKREWIAAIKFAVDDAALSWREHHLDELGASARGDSSWVDAAAAAPETPAPTSALESSDPASLQIGRDGIRGTHAQSAFDAALAKRRRVIHSAVLPRDPATFLILGSSANPAVLPQHGVALPGAFSSGAASPLGQTLQRRGSAQAGAVFGGDDGAAADAGLSPGALGVADEVSHVSGVFGESKHGAGPLGAHSLPNESINLVSEGGDATSAADGAHPPSLQRRGSHPSLSASPAGIAAVLAAAGHPRASEPAAFQMSATQYPARLGRLARQRRDGLAAAVIPVTGGAGATSAPSALSRPKSLAHIGLPLAPRQQPSSAALASGQITPVAPASTEVRSPVRSAVDSTIGGGGGSEGTPAAVERPPQLVLDAPEFSTPPTTRGDGGTTATPKGSEAAAALSRMSEHATPKNSFGGPSLAQSNATPRAAHAPEPKPAVSRQPSLHVDPSVADSVMDDIAAAQRDFAV